MALRVAKGGAAVAAVLALVVGSAALAGAVTRGPLESSSKPLLLAFDSTSGKRQWQRTGGDPGYLAVLAANRDRVLAVQGRCLHLDREYRPGDSDLVAFDAKTGKEVWRARDVAVSESSAVGYLNQNTLAGTWRVVPVLSPDGRQVRVLHPRTGRELWRTPSHGLIPVAANRTSVILASRATASARLQIAALDSSTGRARWSTPLELTGPVPVHYVAGSHAVVAIPFPSVTGEQATMHVIDLADGFTTLTVPVIAPSSNGFVVTSDTAVISQSSIDSSLSDGRPIYTSRSVAYSLSTGTQLWDVPGWFQVAGQVRHTSAVLGTTSFSDFSGSPEAVPQVAAVDARTGAALWQVDSPGYPLGISADNLAVSKGVEYGGSYNVVDSIGALDQDTGALVWSKAPGRKTTSPGSRRFPDVYTTGTFAGANSLYIDGGCAATGLN